MLQIIAPAVGVGSSQLPDVSAESARRPGPPTADSATTAADPARVCLTILTGDTMSEHHDFHADVSQDDQFEKEMRGYSRRQVDEFVARARSQARELENRKKELSRALDDNERLRLELSSARQAFDEKPAHAEISERVGQILKLADDEAQAQKSRAAEEIMKLRVDAKEETDKLRADAKQETERFRTEAHQQAERMLGAAQEQAQNSIAAARTEAEKTRTAARTEAERSVGEAHKQAETTHCQRQGAGQAASR